MVLLGTPCNADGQDQPPDSAPSPLADGDPERPWNPFSSQAQFELADLVYHHDEMPAGRIDSLMDILAAFDASGTPPFSNHKDLYGCIDAISPERTWQCISITHADANTFVDGDPSVPAWKKATYDMWIRDPKSLIQKQLSNPEIKDFIDYAPCQGFGNNHQQVWSDFMTGNWAWEQCVSFICYHCDIRLSWNVFDFQNKLSEDEENHGAMFVPIILGSDKTTVSVATGNNEYWSIYISTGNVHNCACHGHGQAVSLLGFLPIPKSKLILLPCKLSNVKSDGIIYSRLRI